MKNFLLVLPVLFAALSQVSCRNKDQARDGLIPPKAEEEKKAEPPTSDQWISFSDARSKVHEEKWHVESLRSQAESRWPDIRLKAQQTLSKREPHLAEAETKLKLARDSIVARLSENEQSLLGIEELKEGELIQMAIHAKALKASLYTHELTQGKEAFEAAAQVALQADDEVNAAGEALRVLRAKLSPYLWGVGTSPGVVGSIKDSTSGGR